MAFFGRIFVRVQMALLQENIVCSRIRDHVREQILPGQSGRGVEGPRLLLHEVVAFARVQHRAFWPWATVKERADRAGVHTCFLVIVCTSGPVVPRVYR